MKNNDTERFRLCVARQAIGTLSERGYRTRNETETSRGISQAGPMKNGELARHAREQCNIV